MTVVVNHIQRSEQLQVRTAKLPKHVLDGASSNFLDCFASNRQDRSLYTLERRRGVDHTTTFPLDAYDCKKNGNDTLYPGTIEIDDDAREEYWLEIRKQPENVHVKQIRSEVLGVERW